MTAPPPEETHSSSPPIKGLSLPSKIQDADQVTDTPAQSDVPDWLTNSAAPAAPSELATPPADAADAPTPPASDEPEWLARLRAAAPPVEETPVSQDESDVPDWLATAGTAPAESPAPSAPPTATDDSNWLTRLGSSEAKPVEQSTAPAESTPADEPSWVTQLRAQTSTDLQATESPADVPDWLKPAGEPTPPAIPAAPAPVATPDWLASTETPAAPVAENGTQEPDWLKPIVGQTDAGEEGVPDWLRTTPAVPVPPAVSEPAVEPIAQIEIPEEQVSDEEWLRRIQAGEGVQIPTTPISASASAQPFAEEEIPDWLRFATPSASPEIILGATAAQPIEPAQVPDWIAALKPATEADLSDIGDGEPLEQGGPLSGLRGVLPLANAIAEPHTLSGKQAASLAPRRSGAHLFEAILAAPTAPTAASVKKPARSFSIARWLIYFALLFAVLVPLALPPDLTGATMPISRTPAREFFETLDKIATPNATVVLAFEYEPGIAGEMDLQARALARYLASKRVKVATLSTLETGSQIAQRVLAPVNEPGKYEYGAQMINLGYFAGNEVALANLATDKFSPNRLDTRDKKPIRQFLETARFTQLSDAALVIVLAGNEDMLRMWMEQAQPRGIKIAAGVSASVEPRARVYRDAGQLVAHMAGLSGAAQFEILSGKPDVAVRSAGAQNVAVVLLAFLIVVGNIAFLFARARTRGEKK